MASLSKKKSFFSKETITEEMVASEGSGASDAESPVSTASLDGHGRSLSLSSIRSKMRRSISSRSSSKLTKSVPMQSNKAIGPPGHAKSRSLVEKCASVPVQERAAPISWRSQKIEGSIALQSESHSVFKHKCPYLVVTSDYVVKLKSQSDALLLLPQLSKTKHLTSFSAIEPLATIPVDSIVAIYHGEDSLPAFSIEIWWKNPVHPSYKRTIICFGLPSDRNLYMDVIQRLEVKSRDWAKQWFQGQAEVAEYVEKICQNEETGQIFPVVPRGKTREKWGIKNEEQPTSAQDTRGSYLVFGAHFCFLVFVEVQKSGKNIFTHEMFGHLALDRLEGTMKQHEERFILSFCYPFEYPICLEMASRFSREIIRTFAKIDMVLKPNWPISWQQCETFHDVDGFKPSNDYVPRDDFGSVARTLEAHLRAYQCEPVEWEVNWTSLHYSPEFRLLPPKSGGYCRRQLLAVLRALRYNDFFRSLSFRDVDLSVLWNWCDGASKTTRVGYLNRAGLLLADDERRKLAMCPVLYQEFHALAFCSGAIRQIDFTNSFTARPLLAKGGENPLSCHLQFLLPILALLQSRDTKCQSLVLAGNALTSTDIFELDETLQTGAIRGLDVSFCGLDDGELRHLAMATMSRGGEAMQMLNLGGNRGRLEASMISSMMEAFTNLRVLNLCGAIQGVSNEPLISSKILCRLKFLSELDLTHAQLNVPSLAELEQFLQYRGQEMNGGKPSEFYRLVLVNCGITGHEAAKLFNAIGENHGIHLFISGNPIEQGIEELAKVIRHSQGPAALHMEMVEFRAENTFALFINALADARFMSLLSLVGTAPVPATPNTCGEEVISAFTNFFATNTSVLYLDVSGFRGRLEEGQLGKGFGESLLGLRKNNTITYLRVRGQSLHGDVGVLGTVLEENQTIETFDCQENGLNLTSFQYLVDSLKENHTITSFPLSEDERDRIWENSLTGLPTAASPSSSPKKGVALPQQHESFLRGLFGAKLVEMETYLERNRRLLQGGRLPVVDSFSDLTVMAASPGGQGYQRNDEGVQTVRRPSPIVSQQTTSRGAATAVDTSVRTSCQSRHRISLENPADTLAASFSWLCTPSELTGPTVPDDELQAHTAKLKGLRLDSF